MKRSLILGMIVFCCCAAFAEFAAYPMAAYGTDTDYVIGANCSLRFRPTAADTSSTKSTLDLQMKYSQKHQFQLLLQPELYFDADAFKATGELKFRRWPTTFYGIGNTSCSCTGETYTPVKYAAAARMSRRFSTHWRIGLRLDALHHSLEDITSGGMLDAGSVPGSEDYFLAGIGPTLSFDTRDNTSYPTCGIFAQAQTVGFLKALGSDYGFSRHQLDVRGYRQLIPGHIVAAQAVAIHTRDRVPFSSLPQLGEYLRAYDDEKFIDRNLVALRTEYRATPFSSGFLNRLGVVLFAEMGETKHHISDISIQDTHFAGGTGIRFALFRNPRFNVRMDFGWGHSASNLDIGIRESF